MLKQFLNKYFGSTRLFFTLVTISIAVILTMVSFFKNIEITNAQVTLLLGMLANSVAYIAVETIRKS